MLERKENQQKNKKKEVYTDLVPFPNTLNKRHKKLKLNLWFV